MAKLGDLIVRIGADTRGLNTALGNVKKTMGAATKNIQTLGRNMSMGITAPLALMGAASFKVAADFEQSMAKVKAVSGATGAEFKKLEDNAKALGSTTRFTASEVSALQLEYAKLGFSSDEITKVTEATLNLAQATGSDLAQSAEVAGATLRGFGLDASETQRVTDVMAESFSSSALDMASFQNSMKYVAPVAKAAGVSIEETTAMLARMADSGIKGSQAGTSLRMIFQQLAAGGGDVTEKLSALASEGLTLDAAFDEVGRRAQTALLVLGENEDQTKKLTTAFENSTGAAKAMADIMDNTAEGAMKRMNSALEGAQIVIGTALAPLMVKLSQLVAGLANKFSGMSKGGQALALAMAAFAAAIGPILLVVPQLVTGIGLVKAAMIALNTTMLANPYLLAGAALMTIVSAVVLLNKGAAGAAEKVAELRDELAGMEQDEAIRAAAKRVKEQEAAIQEQINGIKLVRAQIRGSDSIGRKVHNSTMFRMRDELTVMEEVLTGYKAVHAELEQGLAVSDEVVEAEEQKGEAIATVTKEVDKQTKSLGQLINRLEETKVAAIQLSDPKALGGLMNMLEETKVEFSAIVKTMDDGSKNISNSLVSVFSSLMQNGKNFGEMMKKVLLDLLIQMAALAAAFALLSLFLPGSQAIAGGFGSFMKGGLSLPAFADGGIVSGPTMGLVGEYPGAKTNPEVIAPLDKLRSMLGGQSVVVTGKISGRDILLTSERNAIDRNRVRGY